MSEYLDKVKQIVDSLSVVVKPVEANDLIFHTLNGLGSEYEPLAMFVTAPPTPLSIDELHTILLTQEHRFAITTQMSALDLTTSSPSANVASQSSDHRPDNNSQGRGRDQSCSRGLGRNSHVGCRGFSTSHNSGSSSHGNKSDTHTTCQLCSKCGHTAQTCYHRFDQSFQPASPPSAISAQTGDISHDSIWYLDSGASKPLHRRPLQPPGSCPIHRH